MAESVNRFPAAGARFRSASGVPPITSSLFLSTYLCSSVLILGMAYSQQLVHWFVVPLLLCGILVASDAVDWIRGCLNVFDPIGILGLLGLHVFFLAPLFHVVSGHWMSTSDPPDDWRTWLGGMALLNAVGLLAYRLVRQKARASTSAFSAQSVWQIDQRRFLALLAIALVLTAVLQVWVYSRVGGLRGYILAYSEGAEAFRGMGWIFMTSESFPIIALIGFAVYARRRNVGNSWTVLCSVVLCYIVLKLAFGGLRGSRSNTIWGVFWAIGVIHFWVRPIPKKLILAGVVLLVSFMYLYGFYKALGVEALDAFRGGVSVTALATETGRTLEATILGDLARSDVQAFLLFRLLSPPDEYQFGKGRTYLAAVALLIPRSIWPDRPPGKVKEGTEAQYGPGAYLPERFQSSRVYGLAGEAMLNFGPFSVPLAFGVLGLLVGRVRHILVTVHPDDARLLLYPLLVNLCFVLLVSDSDNVVFLLVKNGAIPVLLVYLSSSFRTVPARAVPGTGNLQVSAVEL